MEASPLGKKVFFLYPPPVLNGAVEKLCEQEFEVYLVYDHVKLATVLGTEPNSIVFVYIDEGLKEKEWRHYVRSLREDPKTSMVGIGILSMNEDKDLMQHYLMDLQVPCGFVQVKIGVTQTADILAKTLEANEARGRRKFARASCPPGVAQCYVEIDGKSYRGELSDISTSGVALRFDEAMSCKPGTILRGLQLAVKGVRVLVDGFVAARREEGERPTHIVMFAPTSLDEGKKEKLRNLVFKLNQAAMEKVFAAL